MRRFSHSLTPVDTISGTGNTLANSDQAVEDGEMIFVRSTRQVFAYENPSTQVPDGVTVVASNFGAGNWILVPTGGGASYSGYYNTASAGALGSGRLLDVTLAFLGALSDGTKVWVRSVRDSYTWYATRTDVADGLLVVNPTSNGVNPGRFIRDQIASPTWMTQAAWFVDSVSGKDENLGTTSGTALKTDAERYRRWGVRANVSIDVTVTYLNDLPTSDPINGEVWINTNGSLLMDGTTSALHAGTFSHVTAQATASNQAWEVTDGVLDWAPYINKQIVITNSSAPGNIGAVAWIAKKIGAGVARISQFETMTLSFGIPTLVTPLVGDTYEVRKLTAVTSGSVLLNATANITAFGVRTPFVFFRSISFNSDPASFGVALAAPFASPGNMLVAALCLWCEFTDCNFSDGYYDMIGCHFHGLQVFGNAGLGLFGGLLTSFAGFESSRNSAIDGYVLAQGITFQVEAAGAVSIDQLGVFDSPGAGVLFYGVSQYQHGTNYVTDAIFGSGNLVGMDVRPGASFVYDVKPTIDGTTACKVGGTNKTWGTIPFAQTNPNLAQLVSK
jgi:hypothetical protein